MNASARKLVVVKSGGGAWLSYVRGRGFLHSVSIIDVRAAFGCSENHRGSDRGQCDRRGDLCFR